MGRLTKELQAMMGMTVDQAVCMERAAQSSGVPFATLARAATAARKTLAECGQSVWIGAVSADYADPRNWLYNRLPQPGDRFPQFERLTNDD